MRNSIYKLGLLAVITVCILVPGTFELQSGSSHTSLSPDSEAQKSVQMYKKRYKAGTATEKITDNKGNGFDKLYGTRNMRAVLHGIVYRGGANNYYHKHNKRNNKNPLPNDGLSNLAEQGFSSAVYLYKANFDTAPKLVYNSSHTDSLIYVQNSLYSKKQLRELIAMVYEILKAPERGPTYLHCWNGWHQSGYISAVLLKQFCGYTDAQAIDYWTKCADKAHKGYDRIKKKIREFKPLPEFMISKEYSRLICPDC